MSQPVKKLRTQLSPPMHSSTLNESLMHDVQSWHITPEDFFRHHQESMQRTPPKQPPPPKLGSPERNELISGRVSHCSIRLFTPKPELRCSPAKKRLFTLHHVQHGGGVTKKSLLAQQHRKHDPISQFMVRRSLHHVIERIFSVLTPADLHNCRRVSKLWCTAIDAFPALRKSAAAFELSLNADKENPKQLRSLIASTTSSLRVDMSIKCCPTCNRTLSGEQFASKCALCCLSSNHYSLTPLQRSKRMLMDSPSMNQVSLLSSSSKDSAYGSYELSSRESTPPSPLPRRSLGDRNGAVLPKRTLHRVILPPLVQSTPAWHACRGTALSPRSPDRPTLAEECRGAGTLTSKKRLRRLCR